MEYPHQESDFPFEWSAPYPLPSLFSVTCPGSSRSVSCPVGASGDVSGLCPNGSEESGSGTGQDMGELEEVDVRCGGLRVVGIDSDSDSEYPESEDPNSYDLGSQGNGSEELEWGEVSLINWINLILSCLWNFLIVVFQKKKCNLS